ncbi:MAG: fibronectin type III domain-containing protein, partial [Promethearchaeota archaeon]
RLTEEMWQYNPGEIPYIDFSPICPYEQEYNWFELEWRVNLTDFCVYHYADNQLHVGGFNEPPTNGFTRWRVRNLRTQPGTLFLDDFFVRKWVYLEPALGTWGLQENPIPIIDILVNVSYEVGSTGNAITWTPSDNDPSSYNITREGTLVRDRAWNTSGETITISVDGLSEGTYTYRCTVYDSAGQNAIDEVTVTVLASNKVPSPPLNLMATSSSNLVTLSWSEPSDSGSSMILEYRIYRSTYAGHYNFIGSTTSLEFIDTTVSNGMTYYYVVTAVNNYGESDYSDEISVIPLASTSETPEPTSTSIETPNVTNGFLCSMIVLPFAILILFRKRKNHGYQMAKVE